MSFAQSHYELPEDIESDACKPRILGHTCRKAPLKRLRRRFYDTFDWRLHSAGYMLEVSDDGAGLKLQLYPFNNPEQSEELSVDEPPRFAWDLPPGPLREILTPLLEMRALLGQATLESAQQALIVLNRERKTVARILIEKNRVVDAANTPGHSLHRVSVQPIKGYEKPLHRVLTHIEEKLGLAPPSEDLLTTALATLGREPADYAPKPSVVLNPDERTDAAVKRILLDLLDTMERNEAGVRTDIDSEFLHDFRVAVRRTRSALGQIKGIFPPRKLEKFRAGFAWLGQITGPTRDLDVYLLQFEDYKASLPAEYRADLEPLHDFIRDHRIAEQRRLAAQLKSREYKHLIADWRTFLQAPVAKRLALPNAARPVIEVARERIWRMYRRALKEGRAITHDTPAAAVHELRITCKKLRYLIEFFTSLFPAEGIKMLIKALKALQNNLGEFQDLEVQQHSLYRFGEQILAEQQTNAATLIAMGILVSRLYDRQHRVREAFVTCFADFTLPANHALFKQLFRPPRPSKET